MTVTRALPITIEQQMPPYDMPCLVHRATYSQHQPVSEHLGITVRPFPWWSKTNRIITESVKVEHWRMWILLVVTWINSLQNFYYCKRVLCSLTSLSFLYSTKLETKCIQEILPTQVISFCLLQTQINSCSTTHLSNLSHLKLAPHHLVSAIPTTWPEREH